MCLTASLGKMKDNRLALVDSKEPVVVAKKAPKKRKQVTVKEVEDGERKIEQINFGKCSYFPEEGRVSVKGELVNIPPTSGGILMLLSKNQDISLTMDDIKESVWHDKNGEVQDQTVHTHVTTLRKLLGDTPPHKYIVRKKNGTYQLKPKAEIVLAKTEEEKAAERAARKAARDKKIKRFAIVVSVLVLSVSVWLAWPRPPSSYKMAGANQLTTFKGVVGIATAALSHDAIVFEHKKSGSSNWELVAKELNSERYRTLILDEAPLMHNREPSFSRDGNRLAWVKTDYQGQCQVMTADFIRSELKIENAKPVFECARDYYARFPQWKDDKTLIASLPQGAGQPNAIYELDLETSQTYQITKTSGKESGELGVFYNHDNKKIAHLRRSEVPGTWSELRIYDYQTAKDLLLKSYPYPLYSAAWAGEDKLLVKSTKGFEIVELNGKTTPIESVNMSGGLMPVALKNGWFSVVQGDLIARDIAVRDLTSNTTDNSLSSVKHDYRPVVAKNSGDVAFASMRSGQRQIYVTIDGVPKQITQFKHHTLIQDMAISPDGRMVAFVTNGELHIVDRTGAYFHKQTASVSGISFTLDGKGFLWGENSNKGSRVRYLSLENDGLAKHVKTVTHGYMPKSADNGNIYFLRTVNEIPTLYKMSSKFVGEILEMGPTPFFPRNSNSFDVIKNKLHYVVQNSKKKILISKDLTTGKIRSVSPIESSIFSLNSDATILVSSKKDEAQNNLSTFRLETYTK